VARELALDAPEITQRCTDAKGADSPAGAVATSLSALSLKPCSAAGGSQAGTQAGTQVAEALSREGRGYTGKGPLVQGPRTTVHVNAAVVPRIRWRPWGCASCEGAPTGALDPLR